jgi:RNA polymerase sigma-70 factor (ECF subfamily)
MNQAERVHDNRWISRASEGSGMPMNVRSDRELVDASIAGDTAAFDEMMKRYERVVFRVAYTFCNSREDALDITQSVFLKAFRSLETFRNESLLKTWLIRITYNESISLGRRSKIRREEPIDAVPDMLLTERPRQEEELIATEDARRIRDGLEKLNERHRLAVVLRYMHATPIAEIAEVLGCSDNMVKNILFRGVRTLKKAVVGDR